MSEANNAFPFPGSETSGGLDINKIFGDISDGSDENPFDFPLAEEESTPAPEPESRSAPDVEPEPAPDPEPEAMTAAVSETSLSSEPEPESEVAAESAMAAAAPESPAEQPEPAAVNPIAAAFEQRAEENTQQGLLEKPPVFAYGSAREAITDASMTFEELRIAKSDDFPELAEGKRVSWTVEYGKTVKIITDPKGATIQSVKRDIERSKGFLDSLKKAKDKNPDCLVKPKVTAQSKGIAAYKGVFQSLEEARASDKAICLVPGGDGKLYELRKTELGEFIAPKDNVVEFSSIRAGFTPALPLIPLFLLGQIISFFRCYMNEREEFEAMAHILWDKKNEAFVAHIPEQEVYKARINADLSRESLPEDRYLHYADIHSHNSMAAKFSSTDDQDEKATRLYIVLGRLNRFFPEISVRMSCGGVFHLIDPAAVLESIGEEFPHQWFDHVRVRRPPAYYVPSCLPSAFRRDAQ